MPLPSQTPLPSQFLTSPNTTFQYTHPTLTSHQRTHLHLASEVEEPDRLPASREVLPGFFWSFGVARAVGPVRVDSV